jgi:pentatricopeptide repeat protein
VIPAFANLAALEQGKAIHESINRSEFRSDAFVGCTLVDTCAKCGSIKDACNVFDKIAKQDGSPIYCNDFRNSMHEHGIEAL